MITSNSNQQIRNIQQLQKKSKTRCEQRVFVVEGPRMVFEAPKSWLEKIYVAESFLSPDMEQRLASASYEVVSDSVFRSISDTQTPQGILALVRMPEYHPEDLLQKKVSGSDRPLLLVLDTIQDPGNLGTMLRTGEGAGISGVLMNRNTVDIFNPKVIRSTMGSIYRVPFVISDDLIGDIRTLKQKGIQFYAAHLKGEKSYDDFAYTAGCGFLIGNEGNGLSDQVAAEADTYIRIPMAGQVESLNAAMAAGILMYEAARQRR